MLNVVLRDGESRSTQEQVDEEVAAFRAWAAEHLGGSLDDFEESIVRTYMLWALDYQGVRTKTSG